MKKVIGIIPSRYGSTRFPGKSLALISGKTLIQRTYENALQCKTLSDLIVATDDQRIFDHVELFGGKVVMTSESCPTGSDRLAEAITQYSGHVDIVVNIQGDEPCINPDNIDKIVTQCLQDKEVSMTTAVVKFNDEKLAYSTNVVKCVLDQKGHALFFSRALIPLGKTGQFQKETTYYRHLGIYCYKKDFLLQYANLTPTPLQIAEDLEQLKVLEHGYKIGVSIVREETIGVDTPQDIAKIEKLL
jgi:3-deoxy-manno-octulosonate cytidylyltransferase (CMP-KDO synthetase)